MKFIFKKFSEDKFVFKLLFLWIIILSVLYSFLSVLRHTHFQSGGFDLGIYDQTVWQYAHFLFPYNTIKERFILGDHLTLTLPLLAPLFWIWEDVKILLIFQSVFITLSSIAIYKISRIRKFSPFVSLNLSILYSLFYGIQYAILFDFHPVMIGVGLIAWFLYFLETKRWKLIWLTGALILLTQENMGIALASIGFYYVFKKGYRLKSVILVITGIIWSILATKIIEFFSPAGFQYQPVINPSPINLLFELFNSEEKRQVWFYSFSQFSFLPLFSIGSLAAVVLDLSQYFMTGPEFKRMWSPFMHHRAILAPFLLLGVLDVLQYLKKKRINIQMLSLILLMVAIILQYYLHLPLNKLSKPIYWKTESWMKDNYSLFENIPKNASIASAQNLIPHLSQRSEIYLIYPRLHDSDNNSCGRKRCWWLDFGGKPDYLILNLHPNQTLTQLLETGENFKSAVKNMEKAKKIIKIKNINHAYLYKINY